MSNSGGDCGDDGAIGDAGDLQLPDLRGAGSEPRRRSCPRATSTTRCRRRAGSTTRRRRSGTSTTSPCPQINYVHNMEHGGIVIQYGSEVPDADGGGARATGTSRTRAASSSRRSARRWRRRTRRSPNKIVATSWTHMMRCTSVRRERLRRLQRRLPRAAGRRAREVRARPVTAGRGIARSSRTRARAPGWRNGRRGGLKTLCPQGRVSSNLTPGTGEEVPGSSIPYVRPGNGGRLLESRAERRMLRLPAARAAGTESRRERREMRGWRGPRTIAGALGPGDRSCGVGVRARDRHHDERRC